MNEFFLNSNSFYYLENVDGGNRSARSGKSSWLKKIIYQPSRTHISKRYVLFLGVKEFKRMEIELPVLILYMEDRKLLK